MKINNTVRLNGTDNKLESLPSFFKSRFKIITIPIAVALGGIAATDYFLPVQDTTKTLDITKEKALIKSKNDFIRGVWAKYL